MPVRSAGSCNGASGANERMASMTSSSTRTESLNRSPPVHHPVPGADQVSARVGHAVQDAGDGRLAAAVGEGFGDVARWTLDSQLDLGGADLVGQTAQ